MDRNSPARTLLAGVAAGVAATAAMSLLMFAARRSGITPELPPAEIADEAVEAAAGRPPTQEEEEAVAGVAHFGFGAALGVGLAVTHRLLGGPGVVLTTLLGLLYAAGVYLVSYQGWVPALRILPPATQDHPGRVGTMAAAHGVFGVVAGVLTAVLNRR